MGKVTPIAPHVVPVPMLDDEPNPEVIELLQSLLRSAEDGKIQELAIAATDGSNHVLTSNSGIVSLALIGGVSMLLHELQAGWMAAGKAIGNDRT